MTKLIASERETVVAYTQDDTVIRVYSCIRSDINKMRKKSAYTLVKEGEYEGGVAWAVFEIPRDKFDIGRAARATRTLTPEQAEAARLRLQKARNAHDE